MQEENNFTIEHINLSEFNFAEKDFSIFYDQTHDIWYAEPHDPESPFDTLIIQDPKNNILFEDNMDIFGIYEITLEHFKKLQSIVLG
jgi:hypothetical protein